jgi:serine/threonine-protein kinase ATR
MLVEGKSTHSKPSAKTNRMVIGFFEAHILGIMTEFSNSIDNILSLSPSEKLRCVKAIEQTIILAKSKVSVALPQVCSLQAMHIFFVTYRSLDKGVSSKRH